MKNMEAQLQQVSSSMSEVQRRVDQLELGNGRNHEAIMVIDQKLDGTLVQMREEMA